MQTYLGKVEKGQENFKISSFMPPLGTPISVMGLLL